ncbi:MAG: phosphoadenosine phosphosulfate reductase family protein, partial [Deltaproteobacteria bacterium]
MENYRIPYLRELESESIYIIREAQAEFKNPVMLYSIGKDSSVMLHLARKAFAPGKIPFPLLHIDTGYKFREMIEFRDYYTKKIGIRLLVERNEEMIAKGMHPSLYGTDRCCGFLKTKALLSALSKHRF